MVGVHLRGLEVGVVVTCMETKIGLQDRNLRRLQELGEAISSSGLLHIAAGDWNATPSEMDSIGWCKRTSSRVIDSGLEYTCTIQPRREIDFSISHDRLLPMCGPIFLDEDSPTRPHSTIGMDIRARPREVMIRVLLEPRPLPVVPLKESQNQNETWDPCWAEAEHLVEEALERRQCQQSYSDILGQGLFHHRPHRSHQVLC